MDKSPEAFRTISEVAEEMDLPQHVLRFWETRFPQIKPLKRGGGRRYYRPDDVDLLRAVKQLLYGEGYTIKGVQKLLRERGAAMVARGLAGREHAEATKAAAGPAVEKSPAPRLATDVGPAAERGDVVALRAVLADLREAERLLSLARSG
ncbi:MAG: MerR family transcriptional regulator [Roseiarcus sp.]|jgi:DNA-binding transcriptional MerR regulator